MASETNETREKSLNFLEEIIEESIAKGKTRVQTRFPPEPNGYLHIGHAKSICINFGLAKKYGGKCNLRFDDTNPVKEDVEYVDSIKRDIQWLGFDWAVERYASDYFDQLYDWAIVLIKKGLAYVDDQTQEQIRENRGTVSVPGTPSPWRERSVEENLDLFVRMKNGEFPDGAKVLRAKIDMAHPNMLFRDPIMYRIIHAEHHRTGNKWCIYPMYDYAHGQSDSIEQITHSICTLEFDVHRPLYDWAVVLIKKGLAYVDDQTQEQIRENRGTVSVPGTPSPWRYRSVEENLDLFERMKKGEFADGVDGGRNLVGNAQTTSNALAELGTGLALKLNGGSHNGYSL